MINSALQPEFSLVISTLGPAEGLAECLASIMAQTLESFEVIIVDQNDSDHVGRITEKYIGRGNLRYTRSGVGLSKGRNSGLAMARGRIVGFPDDDCDYPATLLAEVKAKFLTKRNASGVCVRCVDHQGNASAGRSDRRSGFITKSNVWRRAVSIGMFLDTDAVRKAGGFDESIGLGSNTPYLSGEETDLLLTLLSQGHQVYYEPALNVYHPPDPVTIMPNHLSRAYSYGMGKGFVLRKHKYEVQQVIIHFAKPVFGVVLAIVLGNLPLARLRFRRAKGRYDGWRSSVPKYQKRL